VSEVLKLPAYRRLLAAYALNELAWAIGPLALAVLVYRKTGSALGAAAFFLCTQFVPALISPAVVARLDQRAARRVLPALYALEGLLFLALAFVTMNFVLVPVLVLVLADGIVALTARSLARATTVSVTSPAGLLREGNALTNGVFSVCYMLGPALGGVIVATRGTDIALFINSGLFAAIAVTLATARSLPGAVRHPARSRGRFRAAVRHARAVPAIRLVLGVQSLAVLVFTISIPVEVVFVQSSLRAGAAGYGALLSGWGGGALVGSMAYARWRHSRSRTLIVCGAGAFGVGFVLMAIAPSIAVAVAGAAVAGAGNGIEVVSARTALQEHVEPEWMALITSLNDSIFQAVPGAGILIGGAIAELAGPRAALATAGAGSLLVAATAWVVLSPRARILGAPL
jgi:predicted MFS family arabinose efflux permease